MISNCAPTPGDRSKVNGVAAELLINVKMSPSSNVNITVPLITPVVTSTSITVDASGTPLTAMAMDDPIPTVMLT
jgi:hypothetical protein